MGGERREGWEGKKEGLGQAEEKEMNKQETPSKPSLYLAVCASATF